MQILSDRQFENLARKSPPVGCLAERHPELNFAAVLVIEGAYHAVFMGRLAKLEAGAKVKLWGGEIKEI